MTGTYEAVLDETVVRAITPDDTIDSILALARACAPEHSALATVMV